MGHALSRSVLDPLTGLIAVALIERLRPEVRIGGMTPGWTELARIPSLACCTAVDLVISRTAPLDAW